MAFANGDDSDVDDDDGEDSDVAACDPMATDEADVDWKAEEEAAAADEDDANDEGSEEVAVVVGCPVFERNRELCNFDRSVLVLLAAVTSLASLPTRTVQGAEGDQWSTPKPKNNCKNN